MTDVDRSMLSSARRLRELITGEGPELVITEEMRVLVTRIASVVGPDVVRRWADELSAQIAAMLTRGDATITCTACRGIGRRCLKTGSVQCTTCSGLGVV